MSAISMSTDEARELWHRLHDAGPEALGEFDFRALLRARNEMGPAEGTVAPDFDLPLLGGDGKRVRLSKLRERPVALIFGSYT